MDWNDLLKALADPNRLRILHLLGDQTLCVCDLEEILGLQQSNLSRHLAKLKQAGLVSATKKGLFMHYARRSLPPPYSTTVASLYQALADSPDYEADRRALKDRLGCDDGCC